MQRINNRKYGFSLLEVVLAIGVFAFASALFIGFANAQLYFETKNQIFSEAMDITDDFCSFVEISSFDDIKGFKDTLLLST
ncbi:MAG: prepilin-type N-terminal cleavage/methylation domain-containing protein [Puniceicoccales bacterium]|nr:prepilin-type N-terminal cleavage/methylation domain-containing protein [Puniceicoccales bacterium]